MNLWVYENWVAEGHKARIHRGDCPYCNNGHGIHPGAGNKNGRWLGPFRALDEARLHAKTTGANSVRCCKHCLPTS